VGDRSLQRVKMRRATVAGLRRLWLRERTSSATSDSAAEGHERTSDRGGRTAQIGPKAVIRFDQFLSAIGAFRIVEGSAGDNNSVSQTFQPAGRFWALNSLYLLMMNGKCVTHDKHTTNVADKTCGLGNRIAPQKWELFLRKDHAQHIDSARDLFGQVIPLGLITR
jgi:hypothetical protein